MNSKSIKAYQEMKKNFLTVQKSEEQVKQNVYSKHNLYKYRKLNGNK